MELCSRGFIRQLMISHDYVSFVDLGDFEWETKCNQDPDDVKYNSRYIHRYVLPMLRDCGFTEDEVNILLVENPRSYFAED